MTDIKSLLTHAYAAAARGDGRPFTDMLADDVRYVVHGETPWSGVYTGKDAMLDRCIRPVHRKFVRGGAMHADHIIVDGQSAAIEGHGEHVTTDGVTYNNRYCWVFRFKDGKVAEMVEYLDSEKVGRALGAPGEGEGPDAKAA